MTPTYIFDLDGTLVDTAPDLCFAINTVISRDGRREIPLPEMKFLIGNGVSKLVERAYARTGDALGPEDHKDRLAAFLEVYGAHQADRSQPYPGVVETLETLSADGATMAVLTNKPHDAAAKMVADFALDRFFKLVWGGGHQPWLKPDARVFAALVDALGTSAPPVMIGDSKPDIDTARNAGAPSVLVSYGYCADAPETIGADAIVDAFAHVPAAATKLISNIKGQ